MALSYYLGTVERNAFAPELDIVSVPEVEPDLPGSRLTVQLNHGQFQAIPSGIRWLARRQGGGPAQVSYPVENDC